MRVVAGIAAGGAGGVERGEESDALYACLNVRGTFAAGVFLAPVAQVRRCGVWRGLGSAGD